ncbi:MAG TPA: glycosyltransferase family 4 protein [Verrucomicrobiae bacterium]|jgi:glycosyltransferase involved in cell wall biosynthesis
MRVVHLLRKYNPAEWGGTETALQRLLAGLQQCGISPVVYCPRINNGLSSDPLGDSDVTVKRFKACVPIWGISDQRRRQLLAVGGNLMSFELPVALLKEPEVSVIHTHALGRLGGIASMAARLRRLPFVVTIHGGLYDLPAELRARLNKPATGGLEWGKLFGLLVQSRRLLTAADAILTCNRAEAALVQTRHPGRRVLVQPHAVETRRFLPDHREEACRAFPQIQNKQVLLCVGRIDPVKNQGWLIDHAPEIVRRHPQAILVFAGACTDEAYGARLQAQIKEAGLQNHVLLTGGLMAADPRLIGLIQEARAVVLPSVSETFGVVILEAWAAGTVPIASRTSGATALVKHGQNGWLFDLGNPAAFHSAIDAALQHPEQSRQLAAAGHQLVHTEYDAGVLAARMKNLYDQLIEEKHALRDPARRRHECVHAG